MRQRQQEKLEIGFFFFLKKVNYFKEKKRKVKKEKKQKEKQPLKEVIPVVGPSM